MADLGDRPFEEGRPEVEGQRRVKALVVYLLRDAARRAERGEGEADRWWGGASARMSMAWCCGVLGLEVERVRGRRGEIGRIEFRGDSGMRVVTPRCGKDARLHSGVVEGGVGEVELKPGRVACTECGRAWRVEASLRDHGAEA